MYTLSKKIFLLWWVFLTSLIFAWCSTKQAIEQQAIQPAPVVQETTPIVEEAQTATTAQTENASYTLQDIQNHNTRTDCRTSINGKIYNLTTAFGEHPWWDDKLALLCWIEWTAKFNTQHWTNEKSKSWLNTLQIWTLK